jgi:hypothetical protein
LLLLFVPHRRLALEVQSWYRQLMEQEPVR